MDKLKLEEVGENEYRFIWPRASNEASDLFFEALDYADEGNIAKAKKMLNKAIEIFPQHIDAISNLGLLLGEKDGKLNDKAVSIGYSVFPKRFNDKGKLEWGWTENRPFLRACHIKGISLLEDGKLEEAIKMFKQLISWNPNDNQGIRGLLADIYTNNSMVEDMLILSKKYNPNYEPSMNFGTALAFYKKGEKEKATQSLIKAVKNFPLCGKILLEDKPKKPKSDTPGYITVGGADQAYEFWKEQGKAWKEADVKNWLQSILENKK